jgi:hypothetical protein
MARKTTVILFALLIAAGAAGAQPMLDLNKMNALKGVSALYVSVVNEDGASKVLDGSVIRTETELRMRQAGIQVHGPEELMTWFVIQFHGNLGIDFYLVEPATLDRGSTRAWTVTWNLTGFNRCSGNVNSRQAVYDGVSAFLNQWLADNPAPKLRLPTKIYQ